MSNSSSNNSRDILFNSIWKAVNDLSRGVIDVWDFKDYILGFMFYRYLSNYICNYINDAQKLENPNFCYEKDIRDNEIADDIKQKIVQAIGFFIYPSELFSNVYEKYKNDYDNLNEELATIFNNIESSTKGSGSESNFKELFQIIDLNSDKLGQNPIERNKLLIKIINEINNWNLDNPQNHKIDIFGDAYEYLISMCSSNAGKTGGNFILHSK